MIICLYFFWIVLDFSVDNRIVQIFFRRLFYLGKKITLTLTPTVRKNFSNCTEKFFQLSGKIFPDSLLIFQNFSIFKFFFSNIFSVFSRFGKKSPENPKKHSVDIIVLALHSSEKFFLV